MFYTPRHKTYDKRDDFDFDMVNFTFLDGDVPRRASYGVYISQLIWFARVCNHVTDFNARNKFNNQTSPTGLSVSSTSKNFFLNFIVDTLN